MVMTTVGNGSSFQSLTHSLFAFERNLVFTYSCVVCVILIHLIYVCVCMCRSRWVSL